MEISIFLCTIVLIVVIIIITMGMMKMMNMEKLQLWTHDRLSQKESLSVIQHETKSD